MLTNQETAHAIRQMGDMTASPINSPWIWPETSMPLTFFGDKDAMLQAVATGRQLDESYWLWQITRGERPSFEEEN